MSEILRWVGKDRPRQLREMKIAADVDEVVKELKARPNEWAQVPLLLEAGFARLCARDWAKPFEEKNWFEMSVDQEEDEKRLYVLWRTL